jgi:hypothetical protein
MDKGGWALSNACVRGMRVCNASCRTIGTTQFQDILQGLTSEPLEDRLEAAVQCFRRNHPIATVADWPSTPTVTTGGPYEMPGARNGGVTSPHTGLQDRGRWCGTQMEYMLLREGGLSVWKCRLRQKSGLDLTRLVGRA